MSEYKRFTKQDDFEDFCENVDCPHKYIEELCCSVQDCDNCYYKLIYTRLAELEDKIESGELGDISELNEAYQELIANRDADIENQERFAEQEGFTPDCTPYYIALQYKKRAEVAERKAKYIDNAFHSQMLKIALDHKYAKEFIKFTLGTITRIYEEAVENAIKQAEKELREGRNERYFNEY